MFFQKEAKVFGSKVPNISPQRLQYAPEMAERQMHEYYKAKSKEHVTHPGAIVGAPLAVAGALVAGGAVAAGPVGAAAAAVPAAHVAYKGIKAHLKDKSNVATAKEYMTMKPSEQKVHARVAASDMLEGKEAKQLSAQGKALKKDRKLAKQQAKLSKKTYKLQRQLATA